MYTSLNYLKNKKEKLLLSFLNTYFYWLLCCCFFIFVFFFAFCTFLSFLFEFFSTFFSLFHTCTCDKTDSCTGFNRRFLRPCLRAHLIMFCFFVLFFCFLLMFLLKPMHARFSVRQYEWILFVFYCLCIYLLLTKTVPIDFLVSFQI